MSNNKQTFNHNPNQSSVDWVIGELIKHEMTFFGTASIPLYIIEKGKAMHKEEIRVAYMEGAFEKMRHWDGKEFMMPTDYFKETFGE